MTTTTVRPGTGLGANTEAVRARLLDWAAAGAGLLVVGGAYLDGWAHNHDKADDTFFTPWHLLLYSSVALTGLLFFIVLLRNRDLDRPWREWLPRAYWLSFAGAGFFWVAGIFDMIWHLTFGIEVNTEALVSPTHLLLAVAALLIVSGPLRAAWSSTPSEAGRSWLASGPMVLSIASLIAVLAFMTQYAHPLAEAFATEAGGTPPKLSDVYVMNADGSGQTRLTVDPERWNGFASWSPDGTKLVVTVGTPPEPSDLFLMGVDGRNPVQLTRTPGNDFAASWSPDGTKIAFISGEPGNEDVFVMSADGSGQTRLTESPGPEAGTSWSADGRSIAFASRRSGQWQVWTMRPDGSEQRQITTGNANSVAPSWSPDGRIAFHRWSGEPVHIWVVDADGRNERRLTNDGSEVNPAWSPAGDRIAYTSFAGDSRQIFTMRSDGSDPVNLTRNPGANNELPRWSADGSKITYTSNVSTEPPGFEWGRRLGLAAHMLQAAFLTAPILIAVRRWSMPFGAMTLVLTLTSVFAAVLMDEYRFVASAFVAGLAADLVLRHLGSPLAGRALHLFAFALPAMFYAAYYVLLIASDDIEWSVHLVAGAVAVAGATGLLLSLLMEIADSQMAERRSSAGG